MGGLLRRWVEFRVLAMSYGGKKTLTTLAEKEFLKLKGQLAADLEWLSSVLPSDRSEEVHAKIGDIIKMLEDRHGLPSADRKDSWNPEEFDHVWHEYYIYLNRIKGMELQASKTNSDKLVAKLPGASAPKYNKPRKLVIVKTMPVFTGVLVILTIFIAARAFGVKKGLSGLTIEPPKSFPEVLTNVLTMFSEIWSQFQAFLDPIVLSYGPTWTAILMGLLLTAFSVLVFSHR